MVSLSVFVNHPINKQVPWIWKTIFLQFDTHLLFGYLNHELMFCFHAFLRVY